MERKLNGVVLRSVPYGENDAILTFFTLEEGVVSAKIKGVKKAGAKLKFATQPFCFAELVVLRTGDKNSVINAALHDGFYPLRENVFSFYAGSVMLEFIYKFATYTVEKEELFNLLIKSLNALCYGSDTPEKVLTGFLFKALSFIGYGISVKACARCGGEIKGRTFFSVSEGAFFCSECADADSFEIYPSTYDTLAKISEEKEITERESLKNALKLLHFFLERKTETEIKALKEFVALLK